MSLTAEDLQQRYLTGVFRYVSRRLARREDAEDVTAEVFAAAFESLPGRRGDGDPFLWLLGIARRKVTDAIRRQARRRETSATEMALLPETVGGEDPQSALARAEARQELRRIVDGLRPDQREALLLQHMDGLSVSEIAVVLGRSPAAVNSLLQRARAAVYRQGQAYFLGASEVSE
jgi:RNA polymerase sigma-70 factor (ECF subfamily)